MTEPTDPTTPVAAVPRVTTPPLFAVDSVEKSAAPDGGDGHDWYRYVLKSPRSTITGLRRGSRAHVHDYATEVAERLNTRAVLCQPSWNPRGRKPASRREPTE